MTTPNTPIKIQRRILRINVSGGSPRGRLRFENLFHCANRVAVDLDRVVDVFAVAPGHNCDQWHFALVTLAQHAKVSFAQTVNGQREPPELVAREWIGAGEIENDLRIESEDRRQV